MWDLTKKQKRELGELKSKSGNLKAEEVVEFAKDPKTALHKRFTWDDTKAAAKWRLEQARGIIRVYVIVHAETQKKCKAFISLSPDRGKAGYTDMETIMCSPRKREQMLQDALAELRILKTKYAHLTELSHLFAEIDKLTASQKRKVVNAAFEDE